MKGIFFITGLIVLVLDQATKHWILRTLKPDALFSLGILDIHHVHNTGAAFGVLQSEGRLFIAIAIMVLIALFMAISRVQRADLPTRIALGMVAGGTIGNLIDRVRLGYVVDFIDLRWWPVFNAADSAICVGVALLIVQILLKRERA